MPCATSDWPNALFDNSIFVFPVAKSSARRSFAWIPSWNQMSRFESEMKESSTQHSPPTKLKTVRPRNTHNPQPFPKKKPKPRKNGKTTAKSNKEFKEKCTTFNLECLGKKRMFDSGHNVIPTSSVEAEKPRRRARKTCDDDDSGCWRNGNWGKNSEKIEFGFGVGIGWCAGFTFHRSSPFQLGIGWTRIIAGKPQHFFRSTAVAFPPTHHRPNPLFWAFLLPKVPLFIESTVPKPPAIVDNLGIGNPFPLSPLRQQPLVRRCSSSTLFLLIGNCAGCAVTYVAAGLRYFCGWGAKRGKEISRILSVNFDRFSSFGVKGIQPSLPSTKRRG